jgi:hypothetical protein
MLSKNESRQNIIANFHKNVLGRYPKESELKTAHKGNLGHWLESNLGGTIDADGDADLNGYECKVESKKTSWGDWGAPYRIFCDKSYKIFNKKNTYENMWVLCKSLGVERLHDKDGVYFSMSGKHIPKYINDQTDIGLSLIEEDQDIYIKYSFSEDKRDDKDILTPNELKKDNLVIYKWHGTNQSFDIFKNDVINNNLPIGVTLTGLNASVSLEERIRRKFGIYGIVIGMHNKNNGFYGLKFLRSITYQDWLSFFKEKNVIYDTALTSRNNRPYNQWRSPAKFMQTLEEEIYVP